MKRRVAILASLLMTAVAGFTGNIFGDANGDGRVDMADVVAVVNAAMGHAPDNFDEATMRRMPAFWQRACLTRRSTAPMLLKTIMSEPSPRAICR